MFSKVGFLLTHSISYEVIYIIFHILPYFFLKYRCLCKLIDTGLLFTRMSKEPSPCASEFTLSPHATQHTFPKTLYEFQLGKDFTIGAGLHN